MPVPSTTVTSASRPTGVLVLPLGLLRVPDADVAVPDDVLSALLTGAVPDGCREAWRFVALVARGDMRGALDALAAQPEPLASYHRFVIEPSREAYAARPGADDDLATWFDVAAFVTGVVDDPPAMPVRPSPMTRVLVTVAQGSAAIEAGRAAEAAAELKAVARDLATSDPVMSAQLLAQCADIVRGDDPAAAIALLREAVGLVGERVRGLVQADLWCALGTLLQETADGRRAVLVDAVQAYHEALHRGYSREHQPDTYALIQNNLGLAYLSMPMREAREALRLAVAVQAFKEALTVYTPETHPDAWASTRLNLANALQYLPSSHPAENLAQAVEIYDELLRIRSRALDPVGHARLLANQANALAHLGMFAPALANLDEAHRIFQWHNEPDLAATALEQVARIHEHRADLPARPPAAPSDAE